MIRQDSISHMLIVLAMMFAVYLATFETTTIILFPAILLIIGIGMEMFLERKQEYIDHMTEQRTLKEIGYYTILALMGIFLTGFMVHKFVIVELQGISAVSYSVLMAIAEEQFFRGFITDLLLTKFPNPWMALLSSAAIFTIYHLARYATQPESLTYVLAGGFILSYVAWKSQRISPTMLAHTINNVIATLGVF